MSKFKPCPFCGGTNIHVDFDDYNISIAYCKNCEASVRGGKRVVLDDILAGRPFNLKKQPWRSAVRAWNRRSGHSGR